MALTPDEGQTPVRPAAAKKAEKVKKRDFIELYEAGKKAYLANDFKTCVSELENSLESYHEFSGAVLKCKVKCRRVVEKNFDPAPSGSRPSRRSQRGLNCIKLDN